MDTQLQQQIAQRAATLPKEVRDAIANGNLPEKIATLGRKYSLMIDKLDILDTEISLVILGLTRPDKLDEALITHVGMDKEKAYAMVEDINKDILGPIRETLMGMHTASNNLPGEEDSDMSRDSLLSGIENPSALRSALSTVPKPSATPTSSVPQKPVVTPLAKQSLPPLTKPVSPLTTSFTAAKLSGTFAPGLPPRPIAAPAIKTMPRSPEEVVSQKVPVLAGESKLPLVSAKTIAPSVPPTPVAPAITSTLPVQPPQKTVPPVYSTPLVKTPAPVSAPIAPKPVTSIVPATGKPGLADAIRSALPNLGATAAMPAPTPKVMPQAPVQSSAPTVPLGREPLPQPTVAPLTPVANPLAGIPPEAPKASTTPPTPAPRTTDPYREPLN
jgi:hypothetical protein